MEMLISLKRTQYYHAKEAAEILAEINAEFSSGLPVLFFVLSCKFFKGFFPRIPLGVFTWIFFKKIRFFSRIWHLEIRQFVNKTLEIFLEESLK